MSRFKYAAITILSSMFLFAAHAQTPGATTVTGFLTDTLSGKRCANAPHVDTGGARCSSRTGERRVLELDSLL